MKLRHLSSLFFVAAICVCCSIPSVDDIHLSNCMESCNRTNRTCMNEASRRLSLCSARCFRNDTQQNSCAPEDVQMCQTLALNMMKNCLDEELDCITKCVKTAENDLKE